MDDIDLKIIKILFSYSRTPYRAIAEKLNLSLNAVHKRVKNLLNQEIINKFTAKPSLYALNGVTIFIFGKSLVQDIDKCCSELRDQNTSVIMLAGGKYVYIIGEIKRIEELQEYSSSIIKKLELEQSVTGIMSHPVTSNELEFTKTDLKVIKSLSKNSRRSLIEISDELMLSPKTIRKIMKRLQDEGMIEFSIDWAPNVEGSVVAFFHIVINEEQRKKEVCLELYENYPNVTHCHIFSNISNFILVGTWFESLRAMKKFEDGLQKKNFTEAFLRIMYNGYYFENWRKKVLEDPN